jgi:hypothetical protein
MRTERAARPTLESLEGRDLQSGVVSPATSSHALASIEPDDYRTPVSAFQGGCNAGGSTADRNIIAILIG